MKIYTKTGDRGETSLYRGGRVPKDAPRLEAYGTLDELNSVIGQALAFLVSPGAWADEVRTRLLGIQTDLFSLGAQLATVGGEMPAWHIKPDDVLALETAIDQMEASLTPLTTFILPGGHPAGATLHVARTVARRAERLVVAVGREDALDPAIGQYLNRLADYLFVASRHVNAQLGTPELGLKMG